MRSLFLVLLVSCAPSPYFLNYGAEVVGDRYVRQCNFPLKVTSSRLLTATQVDKVMSAQEHWNKATDMAFFIDLGLLDEGLPEYINPIYTVVSIKDDINSRDNKLCGITEFSWDIHGCVEESIVFVSRKCIDKKNNIFETIVRHELGHVLGLRHVDDPKKLMNSEVDFFTSQHPVDASIEEVENVKKLYMR